MTTTLNNRATVVSWWIHYKTDSFFSTPTPEDYYRLVNEAETRLEECDSILAREYEEYIPQF